MVGQLTLKPAFEAVHQTAENLREEGSDLAAEQLEAVKADSAAFDKVMAAFGLPKETDEQKAARRVAIQDATKTAAQVPLEVAENALAGAELALAALEHGNPNAASDAAVGALLSLTGLEGALLNVAINLGSIKDEDWVAERRLAAAGLLARAGEIRAELWERLGEKIPEVASFLRPQAEAAAR